MKIKTPDFTRTRLPKLPEGVVVPDDISGLRPPTTVKSAAGAIRWMPWLAACVVLSAAAVLAVVLFNGNDNSTATAQVEELGSDRHLSALASVSAAAANQAATVETVNHLESVEQSLGHARPAVIMASGNSLLFTASPSLFRR